MIPSMLDQLQGVNRNPVLGAPETIRRAITRVLGLKNGYVRSKLIAEETGHAIKSVSAELRKMGNLGLVQSKRIHSIHGWKLGFKLGTGVPPKQHGVAGSTKQRVKALMSDGCQRSRQEVSERLGTPKRTTEEALTRLVEEGYLSLGEAREYVGCISGRTYILA